MPESTTTLVSGGSEPIAERAVATESNGPIAERAVASESNGPIAERAVASEGNGPIAERAVASEGAAPVAEREPSAARLASLTEVLRLIGAVLLLASASVFMLQRWGAGNDVLRYFTLLGHTALLCAAGFFCGLKVSESRGARTFLGLVAASVPVHFAVLGGLIYSRFQWDEVAASLPAHALWVAPSATAAVLVTLAGVAVLLPLCYVSMLALVRPHARLLTAVYFLLGSVLLLPVRHADAIGMLAALLLGALFHLELDVFSARPALRTREGMFVRAMLVFPLAILMGRTIHLYDLTILFQGFILIGIAYAVFTSAPRLTQDALACDSLQGVSAALAAAGWFLVAWRLDHAWQVSPDLVIPLFVLPCALLLVAMSLACECSGTGYRLLAALAAAGSTGVNLLLHGGVPATLICLATGILAVAHGATVRSKTVLLLGGSSFLFALGYQVHHALKVEALSGWGLLLLLGCSLIFAASLFERKAGRLSRYLEQRQTRPRP
jgi:hypothetical protein